MEFLGTIQTWIAQSENFELNNLTFSHYKNHTTGKVSVRIFPHGALCKCSDAFPGSISDEQLIKQIGVIDYCPKGKEVMTDKGFAIRDLCHEKGLHHNRPPLKNNCQYDENDINLNFDIATLRIYNENAIGRISDWSIFNKCWPFGRVDLLGICWIAMAHIVNLTKKPVGPKETLKTTKCFRNNIIILISTQYPANRHWYKTCYLHGQQMDKNPKLYSF